MLKVEKQTEEKRDIKMATATTHEIYGRINLRVVNGQASLHSIKVQQPKQLKVDADENKPTVRQYVWKRSANIARIVSQKLRSAAKTTLAPAA
jgi:methylglutaconyl-CoA hydratase